MREDAAPIPKNYLTRKGGAWRPVRIMDLVTMLMHVRLGAENSEVGFEDTQETLESLTKKLNRTVLLDPNLIESCLWACNLFDEQGKFWDPKGRTFEQFAADVCKGRKFNRRYNLMEEVKK